MKNRRKSPSLQNKFAMILSYEYSFIYMATKGNKSKIGENIRRYRLKLGLSQDALSKKADLAFHTIAKIESGSTPDPRIETVKSIADSLGVSLDDLMK